MIVVKAMMRYGWDRAAGSNQPRRRNRKPAQISVKFVRVKSALFVFYKEKEEQE